MRRKEREGGYVQHESSTLFPVIDGTVSPNNHIFWSNPSAFVSYQAFINVILVRGECVFGPVLQAERRWPLIIFLHGLLSHESWDSTLQKNIPSTLCYILPDKGGDS